jgi:hypothetical protein
MLWSVPIQSKQNLIMTGVSKESIIGRGTVKKCGGKMGASPSQLIDHLGGLKK